MKYKYLKNFKSLTKKDSINKFIYKNEKSILEIKSVHLNFGCKGQNFKKVAEASLAIEIISGRVGKFTVSKSNSIEHNIKKNSVSGTAVGLKGSKMESFLSYLAIESLPKAEQIKKAIFKKNFLKSRTITLPASELYCFSELEQNSLLFKNLPPLNISFSFNIFAGRNQQDMLLRYFDCQPEKSLYSSGW